MEPSYRSSKTGKMSTSLSPERSNSLNESDRDIEGK